MNADHSHAPTRRGRHLSLLTGLLLPVVSLLALGATVETTQFPGEVGTIVERAGDDLVPTQRYRGSQRFDTARLIGEDSFSSPDEVLIARGDLFADSLSGSFVAGNLDAPLLLTESRRLTPDTRDSLDRLNPDRVLLLGGTNAIAQATEDAITAQGFSVERISGFDRFATAREAATFSGTTVGTRQGGQHTGRAAIVARGDRFADALVAGSVSYASRFPLLLTTSNTLHPDARAGLQSLNIETVIIPGGTEAVSANVESEIEAMGITVDRVSGVDRVETSVNFALFLRDELDFDIEHISLSRGERFADALTLGPHAGEEGNPIVLTANNETLGGAGSVAELLELVCGVGNMHVGGGFAAITPDLEQTMRQKAVDTGAICDITFEEGSGPDDVIVNQLGAESRTVNGTVVDNAANPSDDQANVRWQVFRGDFEQENGDVALLEEGTTTTDSDSSFSFEYSAPDSQAWDYVVACTVDSSNDNVGAAPDTCLDGSNDDQLRVEGRRPRNLGSDLASNFQIKQWEQAELPPQGLNLDFQQDLAVNQVDTDQLDSDHTFTAVVTDGAGDPVADANVRFDVFRNESVTAATAEFTHQTGLTDNDSTDEDGKAQLTYAGPASPADDRVTACITDDTTTTDAICGEVVAASGGGETVEPTDALPSDVTRKLWGFLANSLFAEATGVQATLGGGGPTSPGDQLPTDDLTSGGAGSLATELVSQPTSRVELPGSDNLKQDEETDGITVGGFEDLLRAGVTETRAAGQLGTVPPEDLIEDVGDPLVATAKAEATTADVQVLGLAEGPSFGGLLQGVPDQVLNQQDTQLLNELNLLGTINDMLASGAGGDGGSLDSVLASTDGSALVQQTDDGDGNLLGAAVIDVTTTTDCQTGPYEKLADASDSRFVGLEVLGQDIAVQPEPNTVIELPGLVEVVINEVQPTGMGDGDGEFGYEVRGLRVKLLDQLLTGGLDVTISEAITSIDCKAQTFDKTYEVPDTSILADGTQIPGGVQSQTVDVDPRPFLDRLEAMTDRQLFTDEQRAEIDRQYEAFVQSQQ
jgi:putative cell wall-binding protein